MTEQDRWEAIARTLLEHVRVNDEPALHFIERMAIALKAADRTIGAIDE